jgi:adenosine kinase
VSLGIVAPDGREGMLNHAREFSEAGIPFIFDPGQGLPMFSGEELLALVRQSTCVAVNGYEGRLLQERIGMPLEKLAGEVKALVVTLGAEGSTITPAARRCAYPSVPPARVVDLTGCGDGYRPAGGMAQGYDSPSTGRPPRRWPDRGGQPRR